MKPKEKAFYEWFIPYRENGVGGDPKHDCNEAFDAGVAWAECVFFGHSLYNDSDDYKPPQILDHNGQVVLQMCKRCNKAESELS